METIIKPIRFTNVNINLTDSCPEKDMKNSSMIKEPEGFVEKALFLINEEYDIELTDNIIIGSNKTLADQIIPNVNVSRRHCQVTRMDRGFYIEDLGSLNGTYINNSRLAAGRIQKIMPGDKIRIANVTLQLIEREKERTIKT